MTTTYTVTAAHRFNRKQGTPCADCAEGIYDRSDARTVTIVRDGRTIVRDVVHAEHADRYGELFGATKVN